MAIKRYVSMFQRALIKDGAKTSVFSEWHVRVIRPHYVVRK